MAVSGGHRDDVDLLHALYRVMLPVSKGVCNEPDAGQRPH